MAFIYADGGAAPVTRVGTPANLRLSKNNVGFGESVTLSWDAAEGGIGNPVNRYEIFMDDVSIGESTETQFTFPAADANGTNAYTVKAIGKIAGLSGMQSSPINLTVLVTVPSAVSGLSLSEVDVAYEKAVTLSWNASAGGVNNPVKEYAVYRDGNLLLTTEDTSVTVMAPSIDEAFYIFSVKAIGTVSDYNGEMSDGVKLTAHAPTYTDHYFTNVGSQSFTVPLWAQRVDVCCIGGGAGGQVGGVTYGGAADAEKSDMIYWVYPAGGAGGATGYIVNQNDVSALPGAAYIVVVGSGGTAGNAGKASSFGSLVSASGGGVGDVGGNEPLDADNTANGGRGGDGGIGGNGGGAGKGAFSGTTGLDGVDGTDAHSDWQNWPYSKWYVFGDTKTKRRLGLGGRGGDGYALGSYSTRHARGLNVSSGDTCYGGGGRGGDQQRTGAVLTPANGQAGLVAVRCWNYLK